MVCPVSLCNPPSPVESEVVSLAPGIQVGPLIIIRDETHHHHVIHKLYNGGGAVCSNAVVCVKAV